MFYSPLDFHKYEPRGLARQKRNLQTDACSGPQTSSDTQIVFADLTCVGKIQSCQSPGSCRASQRSMFSGHSERRYWWREHLDYLPRCTKSVEFWSKICVVIGKKDRVLRTVYLSVIKTVAIRCLALERLITKDEGVEAVSERRHHEATPRAGGCCSARSVRGPVERALTNFG